jgi:AcrR family transcriptional regulator
MMNRKEKILDKALKSFNERGIEYVGLRELAGMLSMRVSNITYYFPTKDDLVFEIGKQLSETNSKVIVVIDNITMDAFLEMLRRVYQIHHDFRCLLRSYVHVLSQNKLFADAYKKTQIARGSTMSANIGNLGKEGYLKVENEEELNFLVGNLSLISRFWISEAAISAKHLSSEQQIAHYLKMVVQLFLPYATAKGKKSLVKFSESL